ncbi:zinc finger protein 37 homolog isoform X3 [Cheilinus undulatus]|uniref:zinc finger protein 37 homolog isoform X3 n=1 Tax=Cheilinus undulatus TaxID=241271 RepID=UPI001BD648C2|nr:zinc finger protein 37 homolog isoform X3 [Cheilinus undulatus]
MSGFQALSVFPDEVHQLSVNKEAACSEQQEKSEHLKIKDEPEELWSNQENKQIHGLEGDIIKFTFVPVPVKREDDEEEPQSSQHSQKQTKARYFDPERDLQQHSKIKTEDSSDPETDDSTDWREMTEHQSGLKSVGESIEMSTKFPKKLYIYSECGKTCEGEMGVIRRMVVHTKEKPFSCSECGQRFPRRDNMMRHMKSHKGVKPFVCSECDMQPLQPSNGSTPFITLH